MRYRVFGGVKGHPLGCNKPQRQGKPTPNSPRTGGAHGAQEGGGEMLPWWCPSARRGLGKALGAAS